MFYTGRVLRSSVGAAFVLSILTACGGGSSSSSTVGSGSGSGTGVGSGSGSGTDTGTGSGTGTGGNTTIQGVATPSSLAVVTAKNAD